MRLRACLGALLSVALGGCGTIPKTIRLELDDRIVVIDRKPVPPSPTEQAARPEDEAAGDQPR